ncbi:MASE1 domain-containing protein [Xanthomonas sp. A2111]|uniref:MASE1 domain-containing protein n=1 Tax=Xanthomonas hawaiiensis TaxID=3003247 RepID=A0ABU2I839_9XANT|nr:MASE1 domain-containing protein [Xanthomonas sp. A2111]MBO9827599.1 MASE1 domain-containing protein [Xanthomonas sp. A2111]MDS9994311.1 MASE1 domain-containing protein [Xanthomonas sp. A2111]
MARMNNFAKGLLLSAVYCAGYLAAWRFSLDQWFLPAGLRVAALLFMPLRLWPYLLLGDAAAMLVLRVPLIDEGQSAVWAYLSPLLLMPIQALVPLWFRRRVPDVFAWQERLLLVVLGMALWSVLANKALNWVLGGPATYINLENALKFWLGNYLGILVFVLPALLWVRREGTAMPRTLVQDSLIAAVVIAILFGTAMNAPAGVIRQFLLVMMVVPGFWLTLSHNWRGAAVGIVMADIAVAMSLPKSHHAGAFDLDTFYVQLLVAFGSTTLFVLGTKIAGALDQARRMGFAEQEALQVAQASYMSAERTLRNRVIEYTDIHVHINKLRRDIATTLKEHGHYAAAMEMNRTGVIQAQLLDDYVAALYPLDIETHGLYGALNSIAFANACETEVEARLHGDTRRLSMGLQLAAYRCVLNAMEILPDAGRHTITARVWSARGKRGVVVTLEADTTMPGSGRKQHSADEMDWELASRLKAHDGTCRRRHERKISFLISESLQKTVTS